ncbi:MAG: hypothetical protein JXB32_18030, partial [Deltaproteobacteria bacterium]|nr:hypothetical protein [Deltaproteobacteria bacterium]
DRYVEAVTENRRKAALRLHCLECVGWQPSEVRLCTARGCVLHPYRLGGFPGQEQPDLDTGAPHLTGGKTVRESPEGLGIDAEDDPGPGRRLAGEAAPGA